MQCETNIFCDTTCHKLFLQRQIGGSFYNESIQLSYKKWLKFDYNGLVIVLFDTPLIEFLEFVHVLKSSFL
jgi:hypothetical protein